MTDGSLSTERVVLGVVRRLCETAFGDEHVTMLAVVEEDRTTVMLTARDDPPVGLAAGCGASFTFTRSQLRLLTELDVGVAELATSAFRALLERLGESAVDRLAFMRVAHKRLAAITG